MESYTLTLPIKKKFFDMIASGEKPEEYRNISFHWITRIFKMLIPFEIHNASYKTESLREAFWFCVGYKKERAEALRFLIEKDVVKLKNVDKIILINGYGANAPRLTIECLGVEIGFAVPEWSDNWRGECLIFKLGKIL